MKDQSINKNTNVIFLTIIFYTIVMTFNFIFTNNPYFAFHNNGDAGIGNQYKFIINTALILISILFIVVTIVIQNIYISKLIITYFFILVITGVLNKGIFTNTATYIYNIIAITIVMSIAYYLNKIEFKDVNLKWAVYVYILIFFIGIFLAIFYPFKYGYLPFEFSRSTRGEITLWNLTSFYAIFPILSILVFRKYKIIFPLIFLLISLIVVLSTASRSILLVMLLPVLVYIFSSIDLKSKIMFILTMLLVLGTFFNKIVGYFLLSDSTDVTNGRLILWQYHLNYFLKHPFVGNGAFFLKRYGDYRGVADSEIGILSIFSENGIFAGLLIIFIFITACIGALKVFGNIKKSNNKDVFIALTFIALLPGVLDRYSRVLILDDFLFWISMFYLSINIYIGKVFTFRNDKQNNLNKSEYV